MNRIRSLFSTGFRSILIGAVMLFLLMIASEQWHHWSRVRHITTLDAPINSINISPDGTELLAVTDPGEGVASPHGAAIIELATGKVRNWIRKGDPAIRDAVFSPCGKYIVTLEIEGPQGIKFLDRNTLELDFAIDKPLGRFWGLKISRSGEWLAAGGTGDERGVYVWNTKDRSGRLLAAGNEISDFAFSPTVDELYMIRYRAGCEVWNLRHDGTPTAFQTQGHCHIGRLAISTSGQLMAIHSAIWGTEVWDSRYNMSAIGKLPNSDSVLVGYRLFFTSNELVLVAAGLRRNRTIRFQRSFPFLDLERTTVPHLVAWDTNKWKVIGSWRLHEVDCLMAAIPNSDDFIVVDGRKDVLRWRIR